MLTGVNRAHPYLPPKDSEMEENVDFVYRISYISLPIVCTQALMLLFHLCVGSHPLFFNLIYKVMKNDPDGLRVVAFAKRLLHTSSHYAPAIVSGVLFLVSEVIKVQPLVRKSLDYFTNLVRINQRYNKLEKNNNKKKNNVHHNNNENDNNNKNNNNNSTILLSKHDESKEEQHDYQTNNCDTDDTSNPTITAND